MRGRRERERPVWRTRRSRWKRPAAWLAAALAAAFLGLQYRLWLGDGGIVELLGLRASIEAQHAENERMQARNRELEAEVLDLKTGLEALEDRARRELGMIREDETFYLIVEER